MPPFILHVDIDQFLVAVERLRRPELVGKPVVVGGDGDPTRRGVVSTASYEARRFGVGSAMPLRTAARRCPDAVFLPVDMALYREASARVMAVLAGFPATMEIAGWDEAFLAAGVDEPEPLAREIQRAVHERTGLSCSVGIGQNKLQAKIASGLAKPAGVFRLTHETWTAVMEGRPPWALWGVGRKRGRALERLGIHTVGELARADEAFLASAFGPNLGPWLKRTARGEDDSPVVPGPQPARSHSHETTFQEDVDDATTARMEVVKLACAVAEELEREPRPGVRVTVKVRFAPFETHTHSVPLDPPGREPERITGAALAALDRFALDRPVRLLGVRVDLTPPPPRAG